MNFLVLSESTELGDNVQILEKVTINHIKKTLSKKVGDTLKVKVLEKGIGEAVIKNITESAIEVELKYIKKTTVAGKNISLAIGACRPLMMKRIFEHGSTMGVKEFLIFKSHFSEKSYLSSRELSPEKIKQSFKKGLEQTGNHFVLPSVGLYQDIRNIDLSKYAGILYLDNKKGFYVQKEDALKENLLIFIGGERGWHKSEIDYFNQKKIKEVTISDSTLRVEFAVCGFLSQLDFLKNAVN
ncbi:MAG: hypothetical protein CME61_03060 [Halobacteriovoraceae bacterium]|nr:hypothetical protein [Halobacteriovoraceae bacterium]